MTAHRFELRVYYEDTDLAGIVYYANYLKFIERGRSEFLRSLGVDQSALRDERGIVFAVRRVEADYLRPGHFDDHLCVTTLPRKLTGARIVLNQAVLRGEETLFSAVVTIVCLGADGRPARVPPLVARAFGGEAISR